MRATIPDLRPTPRCAGLVLSRPGAGTEGPTTMLITCTTTISTIAASLLSGTLLLQAEIAPAPPGKDAGPGAAPVPLVPREVLFGNPERSSPAFSPCGRWIAFLAPLGGVLNVWIQDADGGDARPVTRSNDRPIRMFRWAYNSEQILYLQDRGGDENFHLFAVDLASGDERNLTPFDGARAMPMAAEPDRPDEVLVSANNRNAAHMDVLLINTRTGATRTIFENTEGYLGFLADADYRIRMTTSMEEDGGTVYRIHDDASGRWEEFLRVPMEDAMSTGPVALSKDGATLYMLDSTGRDTAGLIAVDPVPGGHDRARVIATDARADIGGALIDPKTRKPQAVSVEYLRTEWRVIDESIADDLAALRTLERGDFNVVSRTLADDRWIVAFEPDDGPVTWYTWDRKARAATRLFTNRPALDSYTLSVMRPVEIVSRDGLTLPSYLTVPYRPDRRAVPMVLLVHGGPWGRDSWGFDPYHQWLANRGYAVLAVNFRGSTGFGKRFLNAGNREWYGRMQDDLIDAIDWAIGEGIADPDRIAIMGGSYGGYATLAGLTRDPERFACGIDIVGPSHVRTLLETIPPYWRPLMAMFETRVGSLSEPAYLDSISPLSYVDRIRRPLLIGQGANDPRVKVSESDQIVQAMQSRNIPVTYVVFPDEGHGFAKPENNMAFNAITEIFLAKHLGGRFEPLGDTVALSTAQVRSLGDLELTNVDLYVPSEQPEDPADAGPVSIEDLPPEQQAQIRMILEQLRQMPADQLPLVRRQMESQVNAAPVNMRPLLRYLIQELKSMEDRG